MTRMERRKRRRRIAVINFFTVMAVLTVIGCTVMALSGTEEVGATDPSQATSVQSTSPIIVTPECTEANETPDTLPVSETETEQTEQTVPAQKTFYEEIPLDYDLQAHLIALCEEYGVPLSVALGVIQAESTFRATAQNGSCYGYMQINSINSGWLNEELGVTDLTDPYQNIQSGVYILSDLYGKYGDWHKTLVCYNYGEAGAQKHVFSQGYTTTTYSRTVMAYAEEWEAVLG